jgi:hypothetical protein
MLGGGAQRRITCEGAITSVARRRLDKVSVGTRPRLSAQVIVPQGDSLLPLMLDIAWVSDGAGRQGLGSL